MISPLAYSSSFLLPTLLLLSTSCPQASAIPSLFGSKSAPHVAALNRRATTYDGWTAKGCVSEGTGGRLLTAYSKQGVASLTVQGCLDVCDSMAYAYAGLEFGNECFCADTLSNGGGSAAPASSCGAPCSGESGSSCGGTGYISLYQSTADSCAVPIPASSTLSSSASTRASSSIAASSAGIPTSSSVSSIAISSKPTSSVVTSTAAPAASVSAGTVGSWTNLGCVLDNSKRLLTGYYQDSSSRTVENCQALCSSKGFVYAGLEFGRECYCSNSLDNGAGASMPATDCNIVCVGNRSQTCGGTYRTLYKFVPGTSPIASLSSAAVSSIAAISSSTAISSSATISSSAAILFTQSAASVKSSSAVASSSIPSSSIVKTSAVTSSTASSVAASSIVPSSASATSSASPIAQAKWTSLGCVLDNSKRLLTGYYQDSNSRTTENCQTLCSSKGFVYAGLQFGRECYCSNSLDNGAGASMPATDCNVVCVGDRSQICGGVYRNLYKLVSGTSLIASSSSAAVSSTQSSTPVRSSSSVASSSSAAISSTAISPVPTSSAPVSSIAALSAAASSTVPSSAAASSSSVSLSASSIKSSAMSTPSSSIGVSTSISAVPSASTSAQAKWNNLGCVTDNSKRLLTGYFQDSSSRTIENCQALCLSKGFVYAGLEFGRECYCSNSLDNGAGALMPLTDCNAPCVGNRTQMCGATYRLSLYKYSA